jgi:hypothetical protein
LAELLVSPALGPSILSLHRQNRIKKINPKSITERNLRCRIRDPEYAILPVKYITRIISKCSVKWSRFQKTIYLLMLRKTGDFYKMTTSRQH